MIIALTISPLLSAAFACLPAITLTLLLVFFSCQRIRLMESKVGNICQPVSLCLLVSCGAVICFLVWHVCALLYAFLFIFMIESPLLLLQHASLRKRYFLR